MCNFIDSKYIVSVFLCDCFAAVSASLEDSLASSAKATLQAIGAQEAALQAIMQHTDKLKEAMEAEVNSKHFIRKARANFYVLIPPANGGCAQLVLQM